MKPETRIEEHFDMAAVHLELDPRLEDLLRDVFRAGYLAGRADASDDPPIFCGAV